MALGNLRNLRHKPIGALRRLLHYAQMCLRESRQHPVAHAHAKGAFDVLSVERAGLIRVEGWESNARIQDIECAECFVDGKKLPVLEMFRAYRPDVAAALGSDNFFLGVVVLYRVPPELHGVLHHVKLTHSDATVFELNAAFQTLNPAYDKLLDTPDVLHRENIYAYGPPATAVAEEIQRLARMVPGPVLDFGCGSGALVKLLRAHNIEAYGLEIDRKPIVDSVTADVKAFIKFYDGRFPVPFADGEFESVIATEVIEHVPDFQSALDEITRVTRNHFLITVPDMSSIPICHHNNVVPWHLLESTHVNFFTQASLRRLLGRRYTDIQFARICPTVTNGSKWFGNLVGLCRK